MTFRPRTFLTLPRLLRLTCFLPAAALLLAPQPLTGQTDAKPATDHATSYYHYGLAHLYEEMAVNAGRPDYATQAVEQYKLALDADPDSAELQNGLADLYFKIGRIREAVTAAQEQVKKDPNNLTAHSLLGRVYLRSLGDMQGTQSNEMLQLAIAEYEKLAQLKPTDVETHLLLGQLYGLNHDSAKAEAEFKAAQKIDANSEEVVLNMARLYGEQGDVQRAADTLASVPEADRSARIEFALGASYDQLKKPKEAAAAYQRALDIDPDNLDTERGLASALLNDNQLDAALKVLNQIVATEPQDAPSQIHIADIQRRQGHYDEALATIKKAKPIAQDQADLGYNEALIYDSLGRYNEAVAALTALINTSAHPDGKYTDGEKFNRYLFLDRLGIVYREQAKTAESVAAYRQITDLGGEYIIRGYQGQIDSFREAHQWKEATAVAADAAAALPKDHGVQLMYAGQLADAGRTDEALKLANAQLTGTPAEDRSVALALATIEMRLKRYSDAAAELDKAEAASSHPEEKLYVYYLRGTLLDRQKLYDAAEAEYRKALAIDPQSYGVLNDYGYMLADRGIKLPEALGMIRKAVELDPQNYAYLDSLGWAYYKSGQYTLAEEYLRKANERGASDPTIHDHLADLYEKTGKLKLAVAQWERSMTEYAHALPADADPADVAKVQHKLESARIKLARVSAATPGKESKQP